MQPDWVVPAFDKAKTSHLRFGLRGEPTAFQQLALEGGEEALAHGVVVGIPYGAHGRPHVRFLASLAERERRVLASLVAVVDDVAGLPLADRHLQRVQHQFGAEVVRHGPADDLAAPSARTPAR